MGIKVDKSTAKSFKVGGICAVVGLVLGIVGTLFISNYNPSDNIGASASAVFGRIVEQNELVSVSQDYSIVDKQGDSASFFGLFDIPFTDNSFWYRYEGTLKAGVNLETAGIEARDNNLTITLDPAYIISNTPDMESSGVLEEKTMSLTLSRWGTSTPSSAGALSRARRRLLREDFLMRLKLRQKTRSGSSSMQRLARM